MQLDTIRSLSISLVHMVLFWIIFVSVNTLLTNAYEQPLYKKQISSFTPFFFPVLVITKHSDTKEPYQAHIVLYEQLDKFLEQNPDHTFLVPEGEEKTLHNQLSKYNASNLSFKATKQADGSQLIEVSQGSDIENRGWYQAFDKSFKAKFYLNKFGSSIHQALILPSLIVSLVLYGLAFYIFKLIWTKKTGDFE
jgi:hypothetical protein